MTKKRSFHSYCKTRGIIGKLLQETTALIDDGQYDRAENLCQEISLQAPKGVDGFMMLAALHEAKGNLKKSIYCYEKAVASLGTIGEFDEYLLDLLFSKKLSPIINQQLEILSTTRSSCPYSPSVLDAWNIKTGFGSLAEQKGNNLMEVIDELEQAEANTDSIEEFDWWETEVTRLNAGRRIGKKLKQAMEQKGEFHINKKAFVFLKSYCRRPRYFRRLNKNWWVGNSWRANKRIKKLIFSYESPHPEEPLRLISEGNYLWFVKSSQEDFDKWLSTDPQAKPIIKGLGDWLSSDEIDSAPFVIESIGKQKFLESWISILDPRRKKYMEWKYGLKDMKPCSYEEIRDLDFKMTKSQGKIGNPISESRYCQLFSESISKLTADYRYKLAKRWLKRNEERLCGLMFNWKLPAYATSITRSSQIPITDLVIIEIIWKNIAKWLNKKCPKIHHRWYYNPNNNNKFKRLLKVGDQIMVGISLPRPIENISEISELLGEHKNLWLKFSTKYSLKEGYITVRYPTVKQTRAIILHKILTEEQGALSLSELTYLYNENSQKFYGSWVLKKTMKEYPQLFLRMGMYMWAGVGLELAKTGLKSWQENLRYSRIKINQTKKPEPGTGLRQLWDILEFYGGAATHKDICKRLAQLSQKPLPVGTLYSQLEYMYFVQLSRGLFGTIRTLPTLDSAACLPYMKLLLNENFCRFYVSSRYAGNKQTDFYPLWGPRMEYEWCKWAESDASTELWRSLLYVIDTDQWSEDDIICSYWKKLASEQGEYHLKKELGCSIFHKIPNIKKLLAIALEAWRRKTMNWTLVNRLTKNRLTNNHNPVSYLAILVALGFLKAPDHWQESHKVMPSKPNWIGDLVRDLYDTGELNWETEAGFNMQKLILTGIEEHDLGWINPVAFKKFFLGINNNAPGSPL